MWFLTEGYYKLTSQPHQVEKEVSIPALMMLCIEISLYVCYVKSATDGHHPNIV